MDDARAINVVYLNGKAPRTMAEAADPESYSLFADTPSPWRAVRSYSEISAIVDRNGHILCLVPKEIAGRIVAAINMVECGHRKEDHGRS